MSRIGPSGVRMIECLWDRSRWSQIEPKIVGELEFLSIPLGPANLIRFRKSGRRPGAFMFHLVGGSLLGCKAVLVFLDKSRKRGGGITDIMFLQKGSVDRVIRRGCPRPHHGGSRIALGVRLRS
jgi:hypothetical protein